MIKKVFAAFVVVLVGLMVWFWVVLGKPLNELASATSTDTVLEDYALQDDAKVFVPAFEARPETPHNPDKNVYWGELHVHTQESFDAKLFGTTLSIEDAYRFSRGETLTGDGGETMQLSRPLDFVAITDHAESFGMRLRCNEDDLNLTEKANCYFLETPSVMAFLVISAMAGGNKPDQLSTQPAGVYQNEPREHPTYQGLPMCRQDEDDAQRCYRDSNTDWARYKALADAFNVPGEFTTFSAYEYSPVLPDAGKHHRNVIFNGTTLPEHATSYLDVGSAPALWRALEKTCTGDCDFLTIPHNMNKAWGLFYSPYTWDGKRYSEQDWQLRKRREPLAEIYQVKGASECALGVGATDEECGFSQVLPPCAEGQLSGCAFKTAFARQGLKVGLSLEQSLGFNPLRFGFIGATDTHNANPGDAEEWDFVGKVAAASSPAIRRVTEWPGRRPFESTLQFHTSGGLAAVWAQENTRDAIFSSMQRREAYATSGTRITLRFFAGYDFDDSIVGDPQAIAKATAGGVPMGGYLAAAKTTKLTKTTSTASPTFFVWAAADLMSAPLQRVQVIKGWIDNTGVVQERVRDVACADGLAVNSATGRCPDNGASVDTTTCSISEDSGAETLIATWEDPTFDASESAFYYVRVLQNPTCRWSTYDAMRLGIEPPAHVPATIRERAWSSPIWVGPGQ
ncbi:MAG: DUF3604 domain-containing protein [Halioglobus sp.]